jgi:hypothetical protein
MNIEQIIDKVKKCNDKIFSSEVSKKYKNIIFIYTPPKVGSTSLVSSLRLSVSNKFLTIHVHDENMLNVLTNFDSTYAVSVHDIIEYNAFIGKNVFVIDVYRNPIERKISEYFEIVSNFHFNNTENNMDKYKLDLIINRFNQIFPYIGEGDYYFDKYPITVPEQFDFQKKYLIAEKNTITYIKLRLVDSNNWGKILSEILKTEVITITDYQTENKIIGNLYKQFKNNYIIPSNFLENIINNCRYFNYYNSDLEKKEYFNYWNNRKTVDFIPFTSEEYKLYNNISKENQFYNFIQRNHYLDFGCVCNSCFGKRREIINKIKSGAINVDLKIIHEEVVAEKKIKKVKAITNICNNIQKMQKKRQQKNMGTDFTITGVMSNR